MAFGVNIMGLVVGSFTDPAGIGRGFLDNAGSFTQVNFPGAASTDANGLNSSGTIVGDFFDNAGVEHGYITVH